MEDISRQKLIVALGYVRSLFQEIADEAESRLGAEITAPANPWGEEPTVFQKRYYQERRAWALERIVTLNEDIEKLGG